MIAKCEDCGLVISIAEKNNHVVLSETERLPKRLLIGQRILSCPFCNQIMEIEE